MCDHIPCCPSADSADAGSAHVRADHPEQGWYLLCNGLIAFYDGGCIYPDGHVTERRAA